MKKEKKQNQEVRSAEMPEKIEMSENFEARIKELEILLIEEKASKLMVMADYQNFRKRLESEKNDYRIFATKLIVTQLMQVIDDFMRAKKDIQDKLKGSKVSSEVLNSLGMINSKVEMIIAQNGFEEIPMKEGDQFNPETMEALSTVVLQPNEKSNDNKVVLIDQKGYKHTESGVIFKTAKVIIGKLQL